MSLPRKVEKLLPRVPSGTRRPPFGFWDSEAAAGFAVYREDKRMAALMARTRVVINGASVKQGTINSHSHKMICSDLKGAD